MSTAKITWQDPSTRADGSALAASDIAQINVLMSADNGNTYTDVGHAAPGQQEFDQELDDPGTYLFKLEVVDLQVPPLTSADSAVVSVTVPVPEKAAPSPVTNVAVTLA